MQTDSLKKRTSFRSVSFFYSFLSGLKISFIGTLAAGDLIAVLFFIFQFKKCSLLLKRYPEILKTVKILLAVIFLQLISDVYNETSLNNLLRGIANLIMAIIVIIFLTKILSENLFSIRFIFIGYALSFLIFGAEIVQGNSISIYDMGFVKFTLVPILNNTLFAILIYRYNTFKITKNTSKKIGILFIGYGIFCLLLDSRSNGIFFFFGGFFALNSSNLKFIQRKYLIVAIPVFLCFFQLLYSLYVSNVLSGNIKSEHTKRQLEVAGNPYNPLNLLFSGRTEIYGAALAISDKPLFGHGSWPIDKGGRYSYAIAEFKNEIDYMEYLLVQKGKDGLPIPTHSVLSGIWVTAGIIPFVLFIYILSMFVKVFFRLISNLEFQKTVFFPILFVMALSFVWAFLFSPLATLKNGIPLPLVLIFVLYRRFVHASSNGVSNQMYQKYQK